MKKFILHFIFMGIVLIVVLEVLFTAIIPASEVPYSHFDHRYQIIKNDPALKSKGLFTKGRLAQLQTKWTLNNDGWNSFFNYLPPEQRDKPLIAIIGDSYIENFHCAQRQHIEFKLAELLDYQYDVYSFGRRGMPLSNFIPLTEYVKDKFKPDVIFYVINHRNLTESISSLKRNAKYLQFTVEDQRVVSLPPRPYQLSNLEYWFYKSALVRYTWSNFMFKFNIQHLLPKSATPKRPSYNSQEIALIKTKVSQHIIKSLKELTDKEQIYFVLHPFRKSIYDRTDSLYQSENIVIIKNELQRKQVNYFDLNKPFDSDYQLYGKKFEFSVDRHFNPYANELIAKTIQQQLINKNISGETKDR